MILKTLDQFKIAVPTAAAIENFSDVEPYINSAEEWIKNNVLGFMLYEVITQAEFDDTELINLCQSVIGNHAFWEAIPFLDLVLTNNGFAVISATNKVPASKERVERLREQCLIRRDSEYELLVMFLERHFEYHDTWKSSPAYSVMTDCLIRTATELQQYGNWEGSRRDFVKLRPKIIHDTMVYLEPIFSKDYIEVLIERSRDGDLTNSDTRILTLLKYSLGCLVNGNTEAAMKIAADAMRIMDKYVQFYVDNGTSIVEYVAYANSDEYQARKVAGFENTEDSQIFSSLYL